MKENIPTHLQQTNLNDTTLNIDEPTALQSKNPDSNEQLREWIKQLESTLDNALTLNKQAFVVMGSASRRGDANLAHQRSPDEMTS